MITLGRSPLAPRQNGDNVTGGKCHGLFQRSRAGRIVRVAIGLVFAYLGWGGTVTGWLGVASMKLGAVALVTGHRRLVSDVRRAQTPETISSVAVKAETAGFALAPPLDVSL